MHVIDLTHTFCRSPTTPPFHCLQAPFPTWLPHETPLCAATSKAMCSKLSSTIHKKTTSFHIKVQQLLDVCTGNRTSKFESSCGSKAGKQKVLICKGALHFVSKMLNPVWCVSEAVEKRIIGLVRNIINISYDIVVSVKSFLDEGMENAHLSGLSWFVFRQVRMNRWNGVPSLSSTKCCSRSAPVSFVVSSHLSDEKTWVWLGDTQLRKCNIPCPQGEWNTGEGLPEEALRFCYLLLLQCSVGKIEHFLDILW